MLSRRFGVRQKILSSLVVIIVIGMLSMLLIYRGLSTVKTSVRRLADVEVPLNAAAYEMELNLNGIAFATLKYLATLDPTYRASAQTDEGDFVNFHKSYLRLAQAPREQQLGREIGALYPRFEALGRQLILDRDRQERFYTIVAASFDHIDRSLDQHIGTVLARPTAASEVARNTVAIASLKADIATAAFWVLNYQRRYSPETRATVLRQIGEFRNNLRSTRNLSLDEKERGLLADVDEDFRRMMPAMIQALLIEDRRVQQRQQFVDLRLAMDARFDKEIQVLALKGLDVPRRKAERAAQEVISQMRLIIPLYVVIVAFVGLLLAALITRPLERLRAGTEAIGAGELSHRVPIADNDEFGDLAGQFNTMVRQLQATTVSRAALQQSEEKLQQTVVTLRREIREREVLQTELRAAETMAAMGTLVAGVAHEVRNPLFGISSTLDAMEARFAERSEYRRYLDVLRGQIHRLNKLMTNLLDYGKPVVPRLVPSSIDAIVAQAVNACAPMASERNVSISVVQDAIPASVMSTGRMNQVFQNLIENALQYSAPSGCVTVTIDTRGDTVECSVLDDGPGFDEADLARLFEPFFTRRPHGTGLGLAIVRRIVIEHGGQVTARNRAEGGGIVVVHLPVARRAAA